MNGLRPRIEKTIVQREISRIRIPIDLSVFPVIDMKKETKRGKGEGNGRGERHRKICCNRGFA